MPLGCALALVVSAAVPVDRAARIERMEAAFPIRFVDPSAWTDEDVAAIEEELRALPPGLLQKLPGGVLQLERHPEPAPFGMGDGSSAHPEWTNGLGRFHLYALGKADPNERRAERATARLNDAQKVRLWRRRAIVHAVIRRWDAQERWSERRGFRAIAGWLHAFERPLTFREASLMVYPGAFSRTRGGASAALDLATFAEEALVPADAVLPGAQPVDETPRCQEFLRWRFLFGALAEAGLLGKDAAIAERGRCPAFDRWADPATLDHAEVLYVAASGRAPESLFGHILLRLVRKPGPWVQGPSFGTAVQLAALTGADKPDLRYLIRGLTGGYRIGVMTAPMAQISRETLESEQRSIRRFRLVLDAEERVRLLERVWELERRGYLEYWFFTDNCATSLTFLLAPILREGREVKMPPRLSPVSPAVVLDALSDAGLIVPEPAQLESIRDRAARAEEERDRALFVLLSVATPEEVLALRWIHARLTDPDVRSREAGWRALEDLTLTFHGAREALYAYWQATVRIERYAVERADAARREILLRSIDSRAVKLRDANALVAARQEEFARESELDRRLAILDRASDAEELLVRAPKRPLTASERAVVDEAEALQGAFSRLTRAHGRIVDRVFSDVDALAARTREADRLRENEQRWAERALVHSGYARLALGGGVWEGAPSLWVQTALMDERLGDQRVHGFRPSSALQVLAGTVSLRPRAGRTLAVPELGSSRLTLIGYSTLQRELSTFRRTPLDAVGWGARLGWDVDPDRPLRNRTTLEARVNCVLDASSDFRRFTTVGLGVHGDGLWSEPWARDLAFATGPELTLMQRLGLSDSDYAEALTLDVVYRPSLIGTGGAAGLRHEVTGTLRADFSLRVGARSVLISPLFGLTWRSGDTRQKGPLPTLGLTLEPR
ncbi:MAG: DUF4105 domain-containing protein [Myxococcaceae bacterium]|nr:DUF4105 domain-containing protein [Myxococcaceae bacterium]